MSDPQNDEIIVITAARPGLWLKKKLAPRRWVGKVFDPYDQKLKIMDAADEEIYLWVKELESIMKKIKKLKGNRARKTVDAAILLGAINKRLQQIVAAGQEVEQVNEESVRDFESNYKLDVDIQEYMSEEDPFRLSDKDRKAFSNKYAGFYDDLKRRWLASRLETKKSKSRQKAIQRLIDMAERTVDAVKDSLKMMEKAVGSGQIGDYVDEVRNISKIQSKFDDQFTTTYDDHLAEIVDPILNDYRSKPQPPQKIEVEKGQIQQDDTSLEKELVEPGVAEGPGLDDPLKEPEGEELEKLEGPSGQPEATVDIDGIEYDVDILQESEPPDITPSQQGDVELEKRYIGGDPELGEGESIRGIRGPKDKIPARIRDEMTHELAIKDMRRIHEDIQDKRLKSREQEPKAKPRGLREEYTYEPRLRDPSSPELPSRSRVEPDVPSWSKSVLSPEFDDDTTIEQAQQGQARQEAIERSRVASAMLAVTNKQFVKELKIIEATNDPGLVAAMIAKYSERYEDVNPKKSIELLMIAENILADVK